MMKALKECRRAAHALDVDSVHDLRVALRRSRTIAKGLSAIDPDKLLRAVNKESRKVFRSLGKLRDVQVTVEWVQQLAPESDTLKARILQVLAKEEDAAKTEAAAALSQFDTRRWRRWAHSLAKPSAQIPRDSPVFEHLALQRWLEARDAHHHAVHTRSRVAWHRVRIALKRFRYTVENFLPQRYAEWSDGLKLVQDLLGAVHDLDVLRERLGKLVTESDAEAEARWLELIDAARSEKLAQYRAKTTGKNSLWSIWRAGLPDGEALEDAALQSLTTWASFLDPDFEHSRRVAALALQLYDAFRDANLHRAFHDPRCRRIMEAAALLHDVGRAKKVSGHHKVSYRLIRRRQPPIGWTPDDMLLSGLVARYHRGAPPKPQQKTYSTLLPEERDAVNWLAATLRFADGLDGEHSGRVARIAVEATHPALMIRAEGYVHDMESAAALAKKKHLLETLCRMPVIVRPAEEEQTRAIASLAS